MFSIFGIVLVAVVFYTLYKVRANKIVEETARAEKRKAARTTSRVDDVDAWMTNNTRDTREVRCLRTRDVQSYYEG